MGLSSMSTSPSEVDSPVVSVVSPSVAAATFSVAAARFVDATPVVAAAALAVAVGRAVHALHELTRLLHGGPRALLRELGLRVEQAVQQVPPLEAGKVLPAVLP